MRLSGLKVASTAAAAVVLASVGATFSAQADEARVESSYEAVRIVNASTGQKLIPTGYGTYAQNDAVVWANAVEEAHGGKQWRREPLGSGYYQIRNIDDDRCLAVGNYSAPDGRTAVVQQTCSQAENQQWELPYVGGGHLISSKATGQVVAPYNSGGNFWAVLEPWSGSWTQVWNFPQD